ncbi:IclR family transcriptional regulator [Nocardia grenadensis]
MIQPDAAESRRSVLGRAFDILECFTDEKPEQTIGSLCAQTGLPPATVHRMLANLTEWGAVERAARGRYRLGMRLWRLGWGVPGARALKDIARPHLVDLHTSTREVVALGSRDGDRVVLADIIAGNAAVRARRLPRHLDLVGSAPGAVFVAYMPAEDTAKPAGSGSRGTGHGEDFRFRQELAEIRRTGVAVTRGTERESLCWIASPIFGGRGDVRATVCVAVPESRLNVSSLGRAAAEAARAVSRGLASSLRTAG